MEILFYIIAVVVGLAVGFFVGFLFRRSVSEKAIGSAEIEAKKIVSEAEKEAETKKKEALVEAKEEILKAKNEQERDFKERRSELSKMEKRVVSKEEALDKKLDQLEKKNEVLSKKMKENEDARAQIDETVAQMIKKLEDISGLTREEAKAELVSRIRSEAEHEAAVALAEVEANLKDESESMAKNIITLAIQRCAADAVAEATVSVVSLPNDDMKGRIIGREGRNIRTIETLTGVDLIIDDTPEAITISGFDPVRREIARLSLEKLISDGRIHPAKIEETVEKCRKEVESEMKKAGEKAAFETGVHGVNPELIKLLGRLKYRTSYGQNVLNHSVEVAFLASMIADELGVDGTLAKRAGLLHDIGKALTQEIEGSHVQIGVDYAKKYHENKDVIHAIEAHHGDVEPQTLVAMIVQAADAISAARPGARREDLENYIKRLKKLEEIANSFDGVEKSFAIQAGREIRIMVKPEKVSDDRMVLMTREIIKKIEEGLEYPGQIKVNLIRESRVSDYAK